MNIEAIQEYCLSFPSATEGIKWENDLVFMIGTKMFAAVALLPSENGRLSFKCTPESYAELVEREGITPTRYNMWKYHWVSLERLDTLPHHELKELLRQSYELVAAKAIKKKRPRKSKVASNSSKKKHGAAKKKTSSTRSRRQGISQ